MFSGFDPITGQEKESNSVVKCSFTSGGTGLVVLKFVGILGDAGNPRVTHTTTALPNGDCKYTVGHGRTQYGGHNDTMAMQINTVNAFVEANVAAICTDAAAVVGTVVAAPAAPAAATGPPSAFWQCLRVLGVEAVVSTQSTLALIPLLSTPSTLR